jgi:hypothetical protein
MSYQSWEPVVRCLEAKIVSTTASQQRVAEAVGLRLDGAEPQLVAAAMLEDYLKPLIRAVTPKEATVRQVELLIDLGHPGRLEGISANAASAWIDYHLTSLNIAILKQMELKRGDPVAITQDYVDALTGEIITNPRIWVISSIDRRGRVHFKGGGGRGAWPSQLSRVDD